MTVPKTITELIRCSGNNFHAKVARWFAEAGWHVVVSPYYMDQAQNKPREIDLIVEKRWPVPFSLRAKHGSVVVRLFVECKYIASESVFWLADKNLVEATALVDRNGPFKIDSALMARHHYLSHSPKVAKLFATHKINSAENEPFYKALNQSLSAMVSMRGKQVQIPEMSVTDEVPRELLEFPVVICSSFENLFSVDFYSESEPTRIVDNFQFEVQYAYTDRQSVQQDEYFLLDFVSFERIAPFIAAIGQDAESATNLTQF